MRSLMWFRSDLRLADNPALTAACRAADEGVIGVFVVCADQWQRHDWGAAKVDFVMRNVAALAAELRRRHVALKILTVPEFAGVPAALKKLAQQHDCSALFFNREYEVNEQDRDREVIKVFKQSGLNVQAFDEQTILPPDAVVKPDGGYYSVFTPFRKRWLATIKNAGVPTPQYRPRAQKPFKGVKSDDVPKRVRGYDTSPVSADVWPAGEREAARRLRRFIDSSIDDYHEARDYPDREATSALSPYLACGVISARQCLAAAMSANNDRLDGGRKGPSIWITQLIWREFYRHVLVGYPRVCRNQPFQLETKKVRWRDDDEGFEAWCGGGTGVPIVDAGMRQLRQLGWMHNRLRMITAMFLTKHLLIDWRRGERFFMQQLIDGDFANNNGGWQWSASTGTDAAPYFRVFNPYRQGERFDPKGRFIRRYCSELTDATDAELHDPEAFVTTRRAALGYPQSIVDHASARQRAIDAFKAIR